MADEFFSDTPEFFADPEPAKRAKAKAGGAAPAGGQQTLESALPLRFSAGMRVTLSDEGRRVGIAQGGEFGRVTESKGTRDNERVYVVWDGYEAAAAYKAIYLSPCPGPADGGQDAANA